MEFLVTMTTRVPEGTTAEAVDDVRAREAAHTAELAAQGYVLRLWRPPLAPGEWRTIGLFAAADATELERVLASMPLRVWRTDEVTVLTPHPSDPGAPGSRPELASYDSPGDLAAALRRAEDAHGRHEKEIGHPDPDWPDWYAAYMVKERIEAERG
jgi:muconolactone delta-isomerase